MSSRAGIAAVALPLLAAAGTARAFVRTTTQDGKHFLWWPTRRVGYQIQHDCALRPSGPGSWTSVPPEVADAGENAAQYSAACHDAIQRSFAAWQAAGDAGCTDLELPYLGEVAAREVGYAPDASNVNSVLFQPATCDNVIPPADPCWNAGDCDTAYPDNPCFSHGDEVIALTTTTYQPEDGTLLDADIELNNSPASAGGFDYSAEQPGDPLPGTTDVENTVTHEAGHFIGLAHNCGTLGGPACDATLEQGVMYANASLVIYGDCDAGPCYEAGEITKRTLKADDVAAVCHVYPVGLGTEVVNLEDESGQAPVRVTGGLGTTCGGGGGGSWLALLALALLPRRRERSQPTAT